uniref:Transmembrane protein 59 n=1 Tax=Hadrurus spadix TaxID=141984 RepID=A0A1W7R9G3_9SCOR
MRLDVWHFVDKYKIGMEMNFLLKLFVVFIYGHSLSNCNLFDKLNEDSEPCESSCDKTYPLHTYPSAEHLSCCKRGCRLFTMIDLIHDADSVNTTKDSCMASCMEAYSQTAERYACNLGCSNQISTSKQKEQKQTLHLLTPLLYIQSMYNNIVDHVSRLVTNSWTLYIQQDTGKMVIVHSQPETVQEFSDADEFMDSQEADFPSEPVKYTGAQLHRLSAYRSSSHYGMALGGYSHDEGSRYPERMATADWLGCISRQSGIPRWLLVLVLFLAVMVMVWLCCATAVTAPEQRLHPQKLHINGDLDYLLVCSPAEKIKIQPPQDPQAPPLPVKINLNQA